MDPNVTSRLEAMAQECSDDLFREVGRLNLTHDTRFMKRLYRLCEATTTPEVYYWDELIPPLVVYTLTLLLGTIGNLLIVVSVICYRRMKSSTNIFLASLAVADLLFCIICIPAKLAKLFSFSWTLGSFMCKFINYMENVLAMSSVLNLTVMSIEKCYAILQPLRARSVCTTSNAKKIALGVWCLAFVLATPILTVQVHKEVGVVVKVFWCSPDSENPTAWRLHSLYLLLVILFIPGSIMSVAYGAIAAKLYKCIHERANLLGHDEQLLSIRRKRLSKHPRAKQTRSSLQIPTTGEQRQSPSLVVQHQQEAFPNQTDQYDSEDNNSDTQTKKEEEATRTTLQIVRMLAAIVIVFIVCWTPLLIINILQSFGVISLTLLGWNKHVKTVCSLLAYFNSAMNPIIYGFMSKNFRDSFHKTLGLRFIQAACLCRSESRNNADMTELNQLNSINTTQMQSAPLLSAAQQSTNHVVVINRRSTRV